MCVFINMDHILRLLHYHIYPYNFTVNKWVHYICLKVTLYMWILILICICYSFLLWLSCMHLKSCWFFNCLVFGCYIFWLCAAGSSVFWQRCIFCMDVCEKKATVANTSLIFLACVDSCNLLVSCISSSVQATHTLLLCWASPPYPLPSFM